MCGSGGGKCEERMGRWLRARNIARSEVVLVSKGGCEGQDKLWAATCGDENSLKHDLEGSLHRLGVEYIDCYLLHRDDPSTPVEKIVDLMDSIVRSGCIHSWGVSNWQLPPRRCFGLLTTMGEGGASGGLAAELACRAIRAVWPNTSFLTAERRPLWREILRRSRHARVGVSRKGVHAESGAVLTVKISSKSHSMKTMAPFGARCSYVALTVTDHRISIEETAL